MTQHERARRSVAIARRNWPQLVSLRTQQPFGHKGTPNNEWRQKNCDDAPFQRFKHYEPRLGAASGSDPGPDGGGAHAGRHPKENPSI